MADYILLRSAIAHREPPLGDPRRAVARRDEHGPQIAQLLDARPRARARSRPPISSASATVNRAAGRLVAVEEREALAGGGVRAGRVDGDAARELPPRLRPGRARDRPGADATGTPRVLDGATASGANSCSSRVRALGITQARWIADYYRLRPRLRDADLDELVARRRVAARAGEGLGRAGLRASRPGAATGAGRRGSPARHATPRCCRLSIRWSGTANVPASCSASTTRWSATRPSPSAATAISCCRSWSATAWSAGSMRRRTGATACSR